MAPQPALWPEKAEHLWVMGGGRAGKLRASSSCPNGGVGSEFRAFSVAMKGNPNRGEGNEEAHRPWAGGLPE